jgi:hypothetical protein
VLLLCGLVAALVAAPSASAQCASLRKVEAFKGYVSENVGASASADWPATVGGGTQTVQLGRSIVGAKVHFSDKKKSPVGAEFIGPINGGHAVTDDVFEDTGSGENVGELKYGGPLKNDRRANADGGGVGLNRQSCSYKLGVHFNIEAHYSGDPEVDLGHWVAMGAFSSTKSIPDDLKLDGHIEVQPRVDFPNHPFGDVEGAVALDSPWMGHLITLFECDSPEPIGNCLNNDQNPEFDTPATFSWHLRPVFKK